MDLPPIPENANLSSLADPWAYFYAISNDTESSRYTAWINAVMQSSNASIDNPVPRATRTAPREDALMFILQQLVYFYRPLIICLGIVGNTVAALIFLRSRLRSLSSSHYLAAVTIINTIYLLSLLIHWLSMFELDTYNRPGWCQFVNFINNTSSFLSIWYLTAFAVDRYICICWPAEAPKMCTRMRARVVIICLLCMGIVVYVNISLTVGVIMHRGKPRCTPLPIFHHELKILDVMDRVVNLFLPYLIILSLTLLIIYNTCKAWNQRLLADNPAQIRNVTIIFLCTCLVFHLPCEICRFINTVRGLLHQEKSREFYFAQHILQHLFHTSLAIHFVLFAVCYPMFRQACKRPFHWVRERLMKFRRALPGDIHLRNVRFHAVQEENAATPTSTGNNNVAHV